MAAWLLLSLSWCCVASLAKSMRFGFQAHQTQHLPRRMRPRPTRISTTYLALYILWYLSSFSAMSVSRAEIQLQERLLPPLPSSLHKHHTILRGSSRTIWREKKSLRTRISTTTYNHLTSINSVIDHCNDGNVLIAWELLDALPAKICWGILTP